MIEPFAVIEWFLFADFSVELLSCNPPSPEPEAIPLTIGCQFHDLRCNREEPHELFDAREPKVFEFEMQQKASDPGHDVSRVEPTRIVRQTPSDIVEAS